MIWRKWFHKSPNQITNHRFDSKILKLKINWFGLFSHAQQIKLFDTSNMKFVKSNQLIWVWFVDFQINWAQIWELINNSWMNVIKIAPEVQLFWSISHLVIYDDHIKRSVVLLKIKHIEIDGNMKKIEWNQGFVVHNNRNINCVIMWGTSIRNSHAKKWFKIVQMRQETLSKKISKN